ncbi:MAG: hypothetical protein JXA14_09335 [Anaerolineae bacterium]|nr:hypothetical protein [Anaerolineae bacterium]
MMEISRRTLKHMMLVITVVTAFILTPASVIQAGQTDIIGPSGSEAFGTSVTALPNGNIVVTDPLFDAGLKVDAGAVFLYDGATGTLISYSAGSEDNDQVGSGGVMVLSNGNFVVMSPQWHYVGAMTWGSGTSGITDTTVSSSNSLVGSTYGDQVGYRAFNTGMMPLSNGNYIVYSPYWDNGGAMDAGAVTWGDGANGTSGVVSAANSLVGSSSNDNVGEYDVVELSNGHYVVRSVDWDNGGASDAGAVTWGNGTSGVSGAISAANSLVGSSNNDQVGRLLLVELSNGNFVVSSPDWNNGAVSDAGAVTWVDGMSGIAGEVSAANSLVGSTAGDQIGGYSLNYVVALSSGNYVVISRNWDNGGIADAGAVTWADGMTGITGAVSAANSLVGSSAGDQVGIVKALSSGDYVVSSPYWDSGVVTDTGAITWVDGTSGITGAVSAANSLVGSSTGDQVGEGSMVELSNGNYVVISRNWDNGGATDAGAVTWVDGSGGTSGIVSAANSLVGSSAGDRIGNVTALRNGHYVVRSTYWDNGGAADAGATTWGDGTTGITGAVSAANSLVGSTAYDQVGWGVVELSNGNYVVRSRSWDNGAVTDAGAVTWGDGMSGITGVVSAANSLVGSSTDDRVGALVPGAVVALANGNYVVSCPDWDNGGVTDAGAVTWGDGTSGVSGKISAANSLVGSSAGDQVGFNTSGAIELSTGHYVVRSPGWDNGTATDAGAVTWGNGMSGITGVVSLANSLVGSTTNDAVGDVIVLSNGNYVVRSPYWDDGWAMDAGAVTWGSGMSGISGEISAANSLVGSSAADAVGEGGVVELSDGHYAVSSPMWDYGVTTNAGAVTIGRSADGVRGAITSANSVRGTAADGGDAMVFDYDSANSQLVVGRPADNIVTLLRSSRIYLPLVLKNFVT